MLKGERRNKTKCRLLTKNARVVGERQVGVVDLVKGLRLGDEGVLFPSTHPPYEVAGDELWVRRVDHLAHTVIDHGLIHESHADFFTYDSIF